MEIKELEEKYLRGLNELLNSISRENIWTINEEKSFEERKKWFENYKKERENTIVFVCIKQNEVVGSSSAIRKKGKRSHVWEIGYQVKKSYRNRGIGTLLMNYLIEFLRKNKAEQVIAWVSEANIPSIRLLEKFKFENVGKIKKGAKLENGKYCDYLLFQREI